MADGGATSSAHSRESGIPALTCIRLSQNWTPAFAGVSGRGDRPAQNFLLGQWNVALDYLCKVYIPSTIPPRYRGAFDQRLQTRGGERWPGHDLASEMRCKGLAVQAALVPACPPGTPRACDGRQAVLPSQERCLKCLGLVTVGCHAEVSPSRGRNDYRGGRGASRLNTARGTPRVWRTCGTLCRSLEPE